jgi:DNA-binding beta-propeller fold protein YncE
MERRLGLLLPVGAVALTALGGPPAGALQPVPGRAACLAPAEIAAPCRPVRELRSTIAMSPDGRSVYTMGGVDRRSAISALARDTKTGLLSQLPGRAGCVLQLAARPKQCLAVPMNNPAAIAITADGREVIEANPPPGTEVVALARSTRTGALSKLPCSGVCGGIRLPVCAEGVTPSPDGRNVYVTYCDGLAILRRDATTGQLTQLPGTAGCMQVRGRYGCARATVAGFGASFSPDGRTLYVWGRSLFVFERDPSSGALTALPCAPCDAVQPISKLVISPDGRNGYAIGANTGQLLTLGLDPGAGVLTTAVTPGFAASDIALTHDGRTLYVHTSLGILAFARGPAGSLRALASPYGNVRLARNGVATPTSIVVSPDGRFVYATSGDGGDSKPKRIVTFRRTP